MNRRMFVSAFSVCACLPFAAVGGWPGVARAACRVKTQTIASEIVTPVPLAVSVGVPVAEVTPYYYSYSAYSAYSQPAPAVDVDALATKLAEKLTASGGTGGGNGPQPQPSPAPTPQPGPLSSPDPINKLEPQSLVAQKCAQCHSGLSPKANLALDNPARLDCPTRLKAIRAVLSEKMPLGGKLTPDEAGKVLSELVGQ